VPVEVRDRLRAFRQHADPSHRLLAEQRSKGRTDVIDRLEVRGFGPRRLLFGTDWPVCRLVSTYGDVVAASLALASELTPSERDRVMGGTAAEVYRLR
jgi:predicted TIM-barrel fold metal-dependent hydrolase